MLILFVLAGAVIIGQLVNLQLVNGSQNLEESKMKLLNTWKVTARRGNILDRNGIPLAISRQAYKVQIIKAKLSDDELNRCLYNLIKLFERNNESWFNDFTKLITFEKVTEKGTDGKNTTVIKLGFGPWTSGKTSKEKLESLKATFKRELGLRSARLNSISSLTEFFEYLRNDVYKIDKKFSDEDAYKIMTLRYQIRGFDTNTPMTIAQDVSEKTMAIIEEMHNEYPGVTTDVEPVRMYMDGYLAAHVLGYVGKIDEPKKGYDINSIIGKCGVELAAEKYLRGKDGIRSVKVNTMGRKTGDLDYNEEPAIPGNDVQITLDMNLQRVAAQALERRIYEIRQNSYEYGTWDRRNFRDACAGAVVAIDVRTGEVLAMASYPSYDPSLFLPGSKTKQELQALEDLLTNKSGLFNMNNRAISGSYAPGSTFKPLVAIAGLEEGVIKPGEKILDEGYLRFSDRTLYCLSGGHGYINVQQGLYTSCNIFFYKIGMATGIDKIAKWATYFGLGKKTGIDVDSGAESAGTLATRELKWKIEGTEWYPLNTAMASIGQLYNSFTPLQLANYTAAIANGGRLYRPYIIKRVIDNNGQIIQETTPKYKKIPVKESTLKAIREGMEAVTSHYDGTATVVFRDLPIKVAGKTGTAEVGTGSGETKSNNGVFISYAPAGDPNRPPEIAVAVVIEHGVYGYFAAQVAKEIFIEYFGLNKTKTDSSALTADVPQIIW